MDHAAAHEHLADLALEPGRLSTIATDESPDGVAFRRHLDACADCRAELEASRRVYAALDVAVEPDDLPVPGVAPDAGSVRGEIGHRRLADLDRRRVAPPADLRARVLAGARAEAPITAGEAVPRRGRRPRRPRGAYLALAAAVIVAVAAGGIAVDRGRQLDATRSEVVELTTATATLDRVLAEPDHWVATLRAVDGTAGGTLAWSDTEVVVLTSALPAPAAGATYRCWIEQGGQRSPVGTMSFADTIGYWAGEMGPWGGPPQPGSRFGVSLVPAGGGGAPSAVLVAQL